MELKVPAGEFELDTTGRLLSNDDDCIDMQSLIYNKLIMIVRVIKTLFCVQRCLFILHNTLL